MSKKTKAAAERREITKFPEQARSKLIWGAVAAVALIVGVVVIAGAREDNADARASTPAAQLTVSGSLPRMPEAGPDPAVGMVAPKLAGANFEGDEVVVSAGTARVIVFAAHWCPACNKELPIIADHLADNPLPENVEVVVVSTSAKAGAPGHPAGGWLANDMGWPTMDRVIVDSSRNEAAAAYGLGAFPYFVAVNADGEVAGRDVGMIPEWRFDDLVRSATGLPRATGTEAPTT